MRKDSIEEVDTLYRELSTEVFKMNNLLGIGQLFLNHAFYDAKLLEKIIRYAWREGGTGMVQLHVQPIFPTGRNQEQNS